MEDSLMISEEDFLKILSTVRTVGDIDFIDYEPYLLCHRFERFMQMQGYASVALLIDKMMQDKNFIDFFLYKIKVGTTEMFRDPQMWLELQKNVFPKFSGETVLKIWLPDVCGDDELNTLLILLEKNNLLVKSMIYATSYSERVLDDVKMGTIEPKKMEVSLDNYKQFSPDTEFFANCFFKSDRFQCLSPKLLDKVIYLKHNVIHEEPPDNGFNLIIFRNRALYYNMSSRKTTIEKLYRSLLPGGYFAIGIGETLRGLEQNTKFVPVSKTENIFKKP